MADITLEKLDRRITDLEEVFQKEAQALALSIKHLMVCLGMAMTKGQSGLGWQIVEQKSQHLNGIFPRMLNEIQEIKKALGEKRIIVPEMKIIPN